MNRIFVYAVLIGILSLWGSDATDENENKFVTLPNTTRTIHKQYVIMLAGDVEIDDFKASLQTQTIKDEPKWFIKYIYNFTTPLSIVPRRGATISNVSHIALQWLLESDMVISVTPVCFKVI